ncbi:MAG: hypothetical protein JWM80_6000 [Cyanobacteria bacterium RYN_339]|nr:hypothetical protein [Cyanobacteria bacterium RYN_339]
MTRRIAITGTDGTGKTTLVRKLAERFADRPRVLRAFRAPQYHEHPDHPFGRLSATIDALSEQGDRDGNPLLKATALFLSMTLYGDVERHLAATYAPEVLVAERQCLADSLTYARFYLPLLKAPLTPCELPAGALAQLEAWLPVFQARADLGTCSFWELPLYIRDLFSQEPAHLLASLQALYHADVPDQVVLLHVGADALTARLAEKRGVAGAPPRELHEQAHVLGMFQQGLAQSCDYLRTIKPSLVITPVDTSDRTIDESVLAVLSAIGFETQDAPTFSGVNLNTL